MITGVIKNKIDKIWEDIWAGGLTMPFKVIEQITYLMFIRKLDEKEIDNEKRANSLRRRNPNAKVEMIFPQTKLLLVKGCVGVILKPPIRKLSLIL